MRIFRNILFSMLLAAMSPICADGASESLRIDRKAVTLRNNPVVEGFDSLASLTVGNGHFAATVDVTGLQSYPEYCRNGVPLNTMSDWGWHSFPNTEGLTHAETEREMDLGHGHKEVYAVEYKKEGRNKDATDYFRVNPHRLNLATVGLALKDSAGRRIDAEELKPAHQELSLFDGTIHSRFAADGKNVEVTTACMNDYDCLFAKVKSDLLKDGRAAIEIRFSYPTGKHADDANDWNSPQKHLSNVVATDDNSVLIERNVDNTKYYVRVGWEGDAVLEKTSAHTFVLSTEGSELAFFAEFMQDDTEREESFNFAKSLSAVANTWHDFWNNGAIVDFSACTDPRAKELERRTVLSQYLTAVNCANNMPPQETGLTYNSWFGRPHLEMTWFHAVHFALWNRTEILGKMLEWYNDSAFTAARNIAARQGFKGARWMKMTDPHAGEAPSNTGSFLIWQQPHYIYMAEEMYRAMPTSTTLAKYSDEVEATAEFMADYAASCDKGGKIRLYGHTAMQESMSKDFSYCHPFEQAYWYYGLSVAQKWRERQGKPRNAQWDDIISRIAPLAADSGRYVSGLPLLPFEGSSQLSESADFDPFVTPEQSGAKQISKADFAFKCRSDHPAVLGACGLLPQSPLYDKETMKSTLEWIEANWNWEKTWGWDYGMTAMCAARIDESNAAINALLTPRQKNTYLISGHNYQEPKRLRLYLPGNGSLLTAIAMMCAGWDGCPDIPNPGFPADGKWNVKWEGLKRMQ